jgi:hypothetical protein
MRGHRIPDPGPFRGLSLPMAVPSPDAIPPIFAPTFAPISWEPCDLTPAGITIRGPTPKTRNPSGLVLVPDCGVGSGSLRLFRNLRAGSMSLCVRSGTCPLPTFRNRNVAKETPVPEQATYVLEHATSVLEQTRSTGTTRSFPNRMGCGSMIFGILIVAKAVHSSICPFHVQDFVCSGADLRFGMHGGSGPGACSGTGYVLFGNGRPFRSARPLWHRHMSRNIGMFPNTPGLVPTGRLFRRGPTYSYSYSYSWNRPPVPEGPYSGWMPSRLRCRAAARAPIMGVSGGPSPLEPGSPGPGPCGLG